MTRLMVRHVLDRLGLSLNEAKTRTVDATQAPFDFLGFSIRMNRGRRTGKPYPNVCPAARSIRKIKAKLTALTGRELTPVALDKIVGNVNRSLSGWVNYFHYRNSNLALEKVKVHAERRPLPESGPIPAARVIQGSHGSGLEIGACLCVKNIGKPCAGKPHARFDEGGQARACPLLYRKCVTRKCANCWEMSGLMNKPGLVKLSEGDYLPSIKEFDQKRP